MKPRSRSIFVFPGKASASSRRRLRIFGSSSGQSLVELALLAPVLLLLTVGIVEMGRYAYLAIVLANSARAGASYGAQGLAYSVDTAGITNAATNDFNDFGETSGLKLTPAPTVICGCDTGGTVAAVACTGSTAGSCAGSSHWVVTVRVTAAATFKPLFKFPGIPATLPMSVTSQMRVKQE